MRAEETKSKTHKKKRASRTKQTTTISGCAIRGSSICNAKKAEGLTSARHRTSAATAVVSASTSATAEQKQHDDDPAGIITAAAAVSAAIVSTEAHQANDPENTAAGIISEKTGSIAASTSAVIVATTAVISASAVCSS